MSASFNDIRVLLRDFESNPESILSHMDEISELTKEMDSVGTDTLGSRDVEYIRDFVSVIQAATLAYLVSSGNSNLSKALFISQDEDITQYMLLCIKLAIGLSVMEELR